MITKVAEHPTSNIEHPTSNGWMEETRLLEAMAAQNAEIAAGFARAGNRSAARAHLNRAMEQLSEAEIEG